MVKKQCMTIGLLSLALLASAPFPSLAASIPRPKLKPAGLTDAEPAPAEKPSSFKFPAAGLTEGWSKESIKAKRAECFQRLKDLNVKFTALAPIGQTNGCGAPAPLDVSEIAGVAIVPSGAFTCDMVEALHGWISNSVTLAARQHLDKKVVKISNASAYVCRRRNGLASGKLSEHAKANALDIATLGFSDGSSINIKGDWSGLKQLVGVSDKGNFLRQIRRDSCIRFTTVLGPGSDQYHGDHFHIDVARRNNGYRICK
jgi:hypothetical protein